MIEVEKKFIPTPREVENVLRDAEFIEKESHTDIYYDTDDYFLTTKVTWLRQREGKFELKVPLNWRPNSHGEIIQFRELETESEICQFLALRETGKTLDEDLQSNGYKPFATITTTRKKYKKREHYFVLDETDFNFDILEIEVMVDDESKISDAEKKILEFAKQHGFTTALDTGKVVEWIRRNDTKHYQALKKAGVVR